MKVCIRSFQSGVFISLLSIVFELRVTLILHVLSQERMEDMDKDHDEYLSMEEFIGMF